MTSGWRCRWWKFELLIVLAVGQFTLSENHTLAQIAPDSTLGAESSLITPNITIKGLSAERIDGGAIRGVNLFHSFSDFNVRELQRVYFTNPVGINNILSRVTGKNPSHILGTLGVLGNANLFLINPHGIYFGPNARLDVRGSFTATTADGIHLGENGLFSAVDPENSQLLSVQPSALFTNAMAQHQAAIHNEGILAAGGNLTLAASKLDLRGQLYAGANLTLQALDTVRVRDSASIPFVAAAGNQLLVEGKQSVDIFALNHPHSGFFSGGDMVLRSGNSIGGDAHYWSSGNFRIEQLDGNLGKLVSFSDPIIRSQGNVSFFAYQGASLHILAGGSVNINTVIITEPDTTGNAVNPVATPTLANVPLSDGTYLTIDGSARPTLDVRAGMKPEAIGSPLGISGELSGTFFDPDINPVPPPANNPAATSADITIGNIWIQQSNGTVLLTNQYQPNPLLTQGDIRITGVGIDARGLDGNGGKVIFDSRDNIALDNTVIEASSLSGKGGNISLIATKDILLTNNAFVNTSGEAAGSIQIQGRAVSVSHGTFIFADTLGSQNGIGVFIKASQLTFDGESLLTADVIGSGQGGNIAIETGQLQVKDGAQIFARVFGEGEGGNLTVKAKSVELIGTSADRQNSSGLFAQVESGGSGRGGNLTLDTRRLLVADGAQVGVGTFGEGNGGDLTVKADSVELLGPSADGQGSSGLFAQVASEASGRGGDLTIDTRRVLVADGAQVSVSTFGKGDGGHLTVKAESVELIGTSANGQSRSGLFTEAASEASGRGGNLTIDTRDLLVRDGAQVVASTFGEGDGGNLTVKARSMNLIGTSADSKLLSGLFASVQPQASGQGGNLSINTGHLLVRDGAQVGVGTFGTGDGGDLTVTAQRVELIGSSIDGHAISGLFVGVQPEASGRGGNVFINTERLLVRDGAGVITSTFGEGDGGDLTVKARSVDLIGTSANGQLLSGLSAQVAPGARGNGGDLTIQTGYLLVRDGARVGTDTFSEGNAGDLRVTAQSVDLIGTAADDQFASGLFAQVSRTGIGNGGKLTIDSDRLLIADGAIISAETSGIGRAGDLRINTQQLTLVNGAQARVSSRDAGAAGNLEVNAQNILLSDRAKITAESQFGIGGNIVLNNLDNLEVNSSQISASTVSGRAGNLTINAKQSVQLKRGTLAVEATGSGLAGNLNVNTPLLNLQERASISAATISGQGGDITLENLNSLEINNSQISASTVGGQAGNLTVNTSESVLIEGKSRLSVEADEGGRAGNLTVETGQLGLKKGGQITVSSPTGQAGDLDITSDFLILDRGFITAQTGISQEQGGANIRINGADRLVMRNESLISANAFNTANGGNIALKTKFLIALPSMGVNGNDIVANAVFGTGGQIDITARGLFGIKFRDALTSLNDITASSEFGLAGVVAINRSDFDPSKGLVDLPKTLATPPLTQQCNAGSDRTTNRFVNLGQGGLPPNPNETLSELSVWHDLRPLSNTLIQRSRESIEKPQQQSSLPSSPSQIVQAQGWIIGANGKVILTAHSPAVTPSSPRWMSATCGEK